MSKLKIHNMEDVYKEFIKEHPDTILSYKMFKSIISQFNKKAAQKILEGHTLWLGHKLGNIRIKKIERANYSKPAIDWGETNKLKKQGIEKHVYFTDNFYFRWFWEKARCQVTNKSVYRFRPSGGPNGNRRALVNLLKQDEFAMLNFKS